MRTRRLRPILFLLAASLALTACGKPARSKAGSLPDLSRPGTFGIISDKNGEGGLAVIGCEFEGASHICLLDTGSDSSLLVQGSDTTIDQYPALRIHTTIGASGQSTFPDEVVAVKSVTVSGHSVGSRQIVRKNMLNFSMSLYYRGIDGLIGSDLFADHAMHFDYRAQRIGFDEKIPSRLQKFPLELDGTGHPVMSATIGGIPLKGVWDTGASVTGIDQDYIAQNPGNFHFVREETGKDINGASLSLKFYTADELTLGNRGFRNLLVAGMSFKAINSATNTKIQALYGHNLIANGNWYLDYADLEWASE